MAAASTDKVRKKKSNFSTTLSSGVNDSTTTIPIASSTGLPSDTAITLTIDRVDSNGSSTPSLMERVTGVVGVNQLTTATRGVEGTAQSHSAGAVVEDIWEAASWNDMCTSYLVGHDQAGTHKSGSVFTLPEINDLSADHQYVFSVPDLAADRTVSLPLLLSADTFAFADFIQTFQNKTLIVPTINSGLLMQLVQSADAPSTPASNYSKLYFKSDGKLYKKNSAGTEAEIGTASTDGWTTVSDTWVYASASTFTISDVDRTAIYQKGTKLRFKQGAGYKYATVVSSSFSTNTTVTIAVNGDYTIANSAITDNYYSYQDNPEGFPHWFSFTSTWGGFSANPSPTTIRYSVVGRVCKVQYTATGNGTSNATSLTATLPFVSAQTESIHCCARAVDNGTIQTTPGMAKLTATSATVTFLINQSEGVWTNSGNKSVNFGFSYEI